MYDVEERMSRKKVLQISNYYYPEVGGIENIAKAVSDSLKSDYEMKIVCFTHDRTGKEELIDGIEVIRCGTDIKLFSQQLSLKMYKTLKSLIKGYHPDIIIIHLPNPFLELLLLKLIPKTTKLILYWHSDIVKQKLGRILVSGINDRVLKRADLVIATSENYIEGSAELKRYRYKCSVVPNCIDEKRLVPTEKSRKITRILKNKNKGKIICLCVGRQVPYKGFEYAIEAVNSLDDRFVLYLAGRTGSSTKLLRKLSKGYNNIRFVGETDNDTLIGLYEACDIFCFPSVTKNEAFGIALAEGMYFNKPTVTFTIPGSGVNYVSLNGVTGIEVPNRDVTGFATALTRIADDINLKKELGRNAGKRTKELFLLEDFNRNIKMTVKELA